MIPKTGNHDNGRPGVNIIGFIRAETGIGEACRQAARAMDAVDIPFGILNFPGAETARHSDLSWLHKETNHPDYMANYWHMNPDVLPLALQYMGMETLVGRYSIGFWTWELPNIPEAYRNGYEHVHEIWVPSSFVHQAFSDAPIPVFCIGHAVGIPWDTPIDRGRFGLPEDRYLFLSMYDTHSTHQRKNPHGAIKAFKMAFGERDESVGLVVKMSNPDDKEITRLRQLIGNANNIYLMTKMLSRTDVNCLLKSIDCFVSLHRSEGFGLVIAEAMSLGKIVIATNWSGNTDYMDVHNSCPVDYRLQPIPKRIALFEAGQYWAEPDLEHAAEYMRDVARNPKHYQVVGERARMSIHTHYSPKAVGESIRKRLTEISLL